MKKKLLILTVIVISFSSCSHRLSSSKLPDSVRSAFNQKFPEAKDVEWEKEGDMYEVEFEIGKNEVEVLFTKDGKYVAQKFKVDENDVPAPAINYVKTKYNNAKIKEVDKLVMADGSLRFIVEIKGKEIEFDGVGNFIKETKE